MGIHYLFECKSCGYSCEVSGGDDCGMIARTTTIICYKCKELHDVVTSEKPWEEQVVEVETLKCPKSKRHKAKKWEHPGPCPKCGQIMKRGVETCLWD